MRIIILALLVFSAIAQAQTTTYRDAYGVVTGTSTQNGDKTQYRDAYGTPSGTAVVNGDRVQYRDAYGAPSGSANTNPNYGSGNAPPPVQYQPRNSR